MQLNNKIYRSAISAAVAVCVSLTAFAQPAYAKDKVDLSVIVPHRAVYDVELIKASERSGIKQMSGRIVYEINGSVCEGFTVTFRFVNRIIAGSRNFISDQRTTTYESPQSDMFTFVSQSFVGDQKEREVSGVAKLTDEGTSVELAKPTKRSLQLENSVFMTEHLARLISSAKKGETIYEQDVFDGSDDADEVIATTTFIGSKRSKHEKLPREPDTLQAQFEGLDHWPVSITYFSKKAETKGEATPIYSMAYLLYPNGISRKLTMEFPDYSLTGSLSNLEMLTRTKCES